MPTENERKKRYLFHSRRGMKEVEEILHAYLDRCYDQDDEDKQEWFGRLLDCDDVDLFNWFLGHTQPDDTDMKAYVSQLIKRVATGQNPA